MKNNTVMVSFSHADGLESHGEVVKWFMVSGDSDTYVAATAKTKESKVEISSPAG